MGSKMDPKLVQKLSILVSIYGAVPLGALGSFLELMMAYWAASGLQKPSKTEGFFQVFENAVGLLFEALDGAPGLVLLAFWADMASKWPPK